MPTFTYEAKTRTGEVRTGTMDADDEAAVIDRRGYPCDCDPRDASGNVARRTSHDLRAVLEESHAHRLALHWVTHGDCLPRARSWTEW